MDIYRLIGGLALLTCAWLVQIFGLETFRQERDHGAPKVNVIDFDREFKNPHDQRPLGEVAPQRGWDLTKPFVSAREAERLNAAHRKRQWSSLAFGSAGLLATVLLGWHLWGSWTLGLLAVVLGPMTGALVGYLNSRKE